MWWIALEIGYALALIGVDLFSKWAICGFLGSEGASYPLWEGVVELLYVKNDGASFGVLSGNIIFLTVFTVIVTALIIAFLVIKPKTPRLLRYGLLTIAGGAIGNIYDRIAFGYVRDFIDYKFLDTWFGIDFAIGNIADVFCIVGVFMLIIYMFFQYKEGDIGSFKLKKRSEKYGN